MSRLNDLIRQLREREPALANDIEREVSVLADRRAFGLNFERHTPEAVELPGRRVRRGDKVRVLPPRGVNPTRDDGRLWLVEGVTNDDSGRTAMLRAINAYEGDSSRSVMTDDLVVVAEFRDPIYPGLVSTGRIERGGDQPFHTVINAENYHALQTLLFTHRGNVDCIYIDPPYNTGARDWTYNNNYVEADDVYRHSKWLAFMERRLLLAKQLLKPTRSALIVTIDEKEYARLGLLLEQVFPGARIQMVTSVINATGVIRTTEFTRTNEFIYFVTLGDSSIAPETTGGEGSELLWNLLQRREDASRRHGPTPRLDQFYPIYIDEQSGLISEIGESIPLEVSRHSVAGRPGCETLWPLKPDGTEMVWGLTPRSLKSLHEKGYVRINRSRTKSSVYYLTGGKVRDIEEGRSRIIGRRDDGSVIAVSRSEKRAMPTSVWDRESHNAQSHGTKLISRLIPGRRFPFPKSLYAVEDCLRFFVKENPNAVVLDFFAGSATTVHAVMRLNEQDAGSRTCIAVTNNEISADQKSAMAKTGIRPGDPEWESSGIFEYIARPRLEAAISGRTHEGKEIEGTYRFIDERAIATGFNANLEFVKLTYEAPLRVASNREFARIAALLWMRAGARGRRIEAIEHGWDVADTYGVIADFDYIEAFLQELGKHPDATHAFVVTDDDWLFQSVCRGLPEHVEPVRLYEAYLRNFEFESGGGGR